MTTAATLSSWPANAARPSTASTVQTSALRHDDMDALVDQIRQACVGPVAELPREVAHALEQADWLARYVQALPAPQDSMGYGRHVLYGDAQGRFTVVAIVWQPGKFSPVHAHHTWCAYRVFGGALTEKHYHWNSTASQAEYFRTVARDLGDVSAGHAGLEQIHSLGNASTEKAISVHVYGIDAARIATHVNRLLPSPLN